MAYYYNNVFNQDDIDNTSLRELVSADRKTVGTMLFNSDGSPLRDYFGSIGYAKEHRVCIEHASNELVDYVIYNSNDTSAQSVHLSGVNTECRFGKIKRLGCIPLSLNDAKFKMLLFPNAYEYCRHFLMQEDLATITALGSAGDQNRVMFYEPDRPVTIFPYYTNKVYFQPTTPYGKAVFFAIYERHNGCFETNAWRREDSYTIFEDVFRGVGRLKQFKFNWFSGKEGDRVTLSYFVPGETDRETVTQIIGSDGASDCISPVIFNNLNWTLEYGTQLRCVINNPNVLATTVTTVYEPTLSN